MSSSLESNSSASPTGGAGLESRIERIGSDLRDAIREVLDAVPSQPQGPQALARQLNVDKVLTSRVLKAMRSADAMSVMHRIPGPEPLRRLLKASERQGVASALLETAEQAVARLEQLIRNDLGDRGALDAIVSAWVPEARREFELRRKQSAYKALSQLRGAHASATLATAVLHPSEDPRYLDIVWVSGLFGLHRLRPGASIKLATRRMVGAGGGRKPRTLDGADIVTMQDALLHDFGSSPAPRIDVVQAEEVVHYTLADDGFGPNAAVDLTIAEVNRAEMRSRIGLEEDRKAFVFAEISVPAKVLQFDVLVHRDVYPSVDPSLRIYDTSFEGVADVNDRGCDINRMDMLETIESLGDSARRIGSSVVPRYGELIGQIFEKLSWDAGGFRAYRCRIDYPVYGSQVAMCFDPPRSADAAPRSV